MRELANRLKHMGCINRDIQLAVVLTGPNCDQLLSLRADFSFECNLLLNQLTALLATLEHARLASRILNPFVTMQQVLASHQQRWAGEELGDISDGYLANSGKVHAAVINFLEAALDAVNSAAQPADKAGPCTSAFANLPPLRLTGTR